MKAALNSRPDGRRRCARLVPEHDLPVFRPGRSSSPCWPGPSHLLFCRSPRMKVARVVSPFDLIETIRPEQGRAAFHAIASACVLRPQCRSRLDDLCAGGEQLRRSLIVARVELLAPGSDDALRRGRRRAAAGAERRPRARGGRAEAARHATNITAVACERGWGSVSGAGACAALRILRRSQEA